MQSYQRGTLEAEAKPIEPEAEAIEIDMSDRDRAVREARIKGAERLHNIIGQGDDVAELLEGLGCCPHEIAALRNALDQIKAAAFAIEPRRANERS